MVESDDGTENGKGAVLLQQQNIIKKYNKALAAVVATIVTVALTVGVYAGTTQAYLMSKSDTYLNTFVSGLPDVGELTIAGTKTLEGRSLSEGEFFFELYETDASFAVAEDAKPLQVVANAHEGDFAFDTLQFTEQGEFHYVVVEQIPEVVTEGSVKCVTYDTTQYRITVNVVESDDELVVDSSIVSYAMASDLAEGSSSSEGVDKEDVQDGSSEQSADDGVTTSVEASSEGREPMFSETEAEAIVFTNIFDSPDPTVVIYGAKSLEGRTMKAGEFKFTLFETGEDYAVAEGAEPIQRVSNAIDGAASGFGFAPLLFSEPGVHYYVICEDASDALGGIIYDDQVYRLKVTVAADGETGLLSARVVMLVQGESGDWTEVKANEISQDDPDNTFALRPYAGVDPRNDKCSVAFVPFVNSYEARPVGYELVGDVDLNGRDMAEGEFEFTIESATEGAPMPDSVRDVNGVDGAFGFGFIEFTAPGVYEYVIKQDSSAALDGVAYDEGIYRVIVTVVDDGYGNLNVESVVVLRDGVEVTDGSGVKYVNTYTEPGVDNPDDPVVPPGSDEDEPNTPGDGDDPATPGDSDGPSSDLGQTGDDLPVMLLLGVTAVAMVTAIVAFVMRRRSYT